MADWTGNARTNYVEISDHDAFEAAAKDWNLRVYYDPEDHAFACLMSETDNGAFPHGDTREVERPDPDDPDPEGVLIDEVEFSIEKTIMPFVKEGEVLITFEAGWERQRCITGASVAYIRRGDEVRSVAVNLNDIYERAAAEFGVDRLTITFAEY